MAGKEKTINDIMRYCAQSEHCTQDVMLKLRSWEIAESDITKWIAVLKKENFVNEERYAKSFVHDKWEFNRWGRIKIRHHLIEKRIEESMIDVALETISDESYSEVLNTLMEAKEKELDKWKGADLIRRLMAFGQSRGFEQEIISAWLKKRNYSWDD